MVARNIFLSPAAEKRAPIKRRATAGAGKGAAQSLYLSAEVNSQKSENTAIFDSILCSELTSENVEYLKSKDRCGSEPLFDY